MKGITEIRRITPTGDASTSAPGTGAAKAGDKGKASPRPSSEAPGDDFGGASAELGHVIAPLSDLTPVLEDTAPNTSSGKTSHTSKS